MALYGYATQWLTSSWEYATSRPSPQPASLSIKLNDSQDHPLAQSTCNASPSYKVSMSATRIILPHPLLPYFSNTKHTFKRIAHHSHRFYHIPWLKCMYIPCASLAPCSVHEMRDGVSASAAPPGTGRGSEAVSVTVPQDIVSVMFRLHDAAAS
jgi:hypothetical protein